ncbi:hypothetical protein ACUN9Y_13205 [Halomonas sp. V046]|uniref:hypothetical protein n=1 Tax=Halomonas sp. V046 TaxID=3459611 RepID=UPI0040445632
MKTFASVCFAMAATAAATSTLAFGEPDSWSSGWGQGVSEYAAVNAYGDELYIACSDYDPVRMTLTSGDRSYGSGYEGDFSLIIDGTEVQYPYETDSRVGSNNFYFAWDALRKAHSIAAVTSDNDYIELPSKGSASALPAWGTPEFPCQTAF